MKIRHLAREKVLSLLYQSEIWAETEEKTLVDSQAEIWHNFSTKRLKPEAVEFVRNLYDGVLSNLVELDSLIVAHSPGWKIERLSLITRNILRLALWEILYEPQIPPVVSIDEAVELGKKFSDSKEAGYINALLEKVVHERT